MEDNGILEKHFEANRARLLAVAYRMLGSRSEAEDATQEAWLRLSGAKHQEIANLGAWLTTAIARICLDMLRSRKSRREAPMEVEAPEVLAVRDGRMSAEDELAMADSVGVAMLIVLDTLGTAERLAFVLHDMFAVPFDEIGAILDRSPEATRQLASRARRRVQGMSPADHLDRARQRRVVEAFLAASRGGDFKALLSVLDPDVTFRADHVALRLGSVEEIRGAPEVAEWFKGRATSAQPVFIDGDIGVMVAPGGNLLLVLGLSFRNGRISEIQAIADPAHLAAMDLAPLPT